MGKVVGDRYASLMYSSFDTYKAYRLAAVKIEAGWSSSGCSPLIQRGAWLRVTDDLAEGHQVLFERGECFPYQTGPADGPFQFVIPPATMSDYQLAEQARDERLAAIEAPLAKILQQIDILA